MNRVEVVERYTELVTNCPDMSNAEIARELGMNERALEQALLRARRRDELQIRRRTVFSHDGPRIEIV